MRIIPLDRELVGRFFKHVLSGNYGEAEDAFKKLSGSGFSEWELGYFNAMSGILASMRGKSSKPYAYRSVLNRKFVEKYRAKFKGLSNLKPPLFDEYDRGYFSCWVDFLEAAGRMLSQEVVDQRPSHKPC